MSYTFYPDSGMEFVVPPEANDIYHGVRPKTPQQLVSEMVGVIDGESPFAVETVEHTVEEVTGYGVGSLEPGDPFAFIHSGTSKVLMSHKEQLPLSTNPKTMWEEEHAYMRVFRPIHDLLIDQIRFEEVRLGVGGLFRSLIDDGAYFFTNDEKPKDATVRYTDVFKIRAYLPGVARGRDSKTNIYLPVDTKHVQRVEFRLQNPLLANEPIPALATSDA